MAKQKAVPCPTCGTPCEIHWSGLEFVEASGDETLATKHHVPIAYSTSMLKRSEEIKLILMGLEYQRELEHEKARLTGKPYDIKEEARKRLVVKRALRTELEKVLKQEGQ